MSERVTALVDHFRFIADERMRGLPIVNPALEVEAVAFEEAEGHEIGILITPWFMNLVLLPGRAEWEETTMGDVVEWTMPSGKLELTVARDELGTYLTAVLFRTVMDFPDQEMAREVAREVAAALRREPDADEAAQGSGKRVSRRELFTQLGTSDA